MQCWDIKSYIRQRNQESTKTFLVEGNTFFSDITIILVRKAHTFSTIQIPLLIIRTTHYDLMSWLDVTVKGISKINTNGITFSMSRFLSLIWLVVSCLQIQISCIVKECLAEIPFFKYYIQEERNLCAEFCNYIAIHLHTLCYTLVSSRLEIMICSSVS